MSVAKDPLEDCERVSFVNEHGEMYEVIDVSGVTVAICGDETDWENIPLFNKHFNIWSKPELYMLGLALVELYEP